MTRDQVVVDDVVPIGRSVSALDLLTMRHAGQRWLYDTGFAVLGAEGSVAF